jgi:hypothetical protein
LCCNYYSDAIKAKWFKKENEKKSEGLVGCYSINDSSFAFAQVLELKELRETPLTPLTPKLAKVE